MASSIQQRETVPGDVRRGRLLSARQLCGLRNLQRGIGEAAVLLEEHEVYKDIFLGDIGRVVLIIGEIE